MVTYLDPTNDTSTQLFVLFPPMEVKNFMVGNIQPFKILGYVSFFLICLFFYFCFLFK